MVDRYARVAPLLNLTISRLRSVHRYGYGSLLLLSLLLLSTSAVYVSAVCAAAVYCCCGLCGCCCCCCGKQRLVPVPSEDEGVPAGRMRCHELMVHAAVLPLQHEALGAVQRVSEMNEIMRKCAV